MTGKGTSIMLMNDYSRSNHKGNSHTVDIENMQKLGMLLDFTHCLTPAIIMYSE